MKQVIDLWREGQKVNLLWKGYIGAVQNKQGKRNKPMGRTEEGSEVIQKGTREGDWKGRHQQAG